MEFQSWFSGSVIVNSDGTPMTMYHGTTKDFSEFMQTAISNKTTDKKVAKLGFFFTNSPARAGRFAAIPNKDQPWKYSFATGSRILPVYLSIQNPYIANATEIFKLDQDTLKSRGYDGIIFKDSSGNSEVVAFDSYQIKSIFNKNPTKDQGI